MRAYRNRDIKVKKSDDKKMYYKQTMSAHLIGGWTVKKETQWYTDLEKDTSSWFVHALLYIIFFLSTVFVTSTYGYNNLFGLAVPLVVNFAYSAMSKDYKRILKPIK